jgi:VanZ family protein
MPEGEAISSDKLYHLIEYGILCYLMWSAFNRSSWKLLNCHPFSLAFIASSIYGASDEIHQMFVPGREASIFDWMADILGAFLVTVGLLYLQRLRKVQKG